MESQRTETGGGHGRITGFALRIQPQSTNRGESFSELQNGDRKGTAKLFHFADVTVTN